MVEREDIKNLASAIQYWLSYWDTVSRTNILQESSLRYSISEIIERRFQGACLLEKTHPVFSSRNIDIVWAEKDCENNILDPFLKKGKDFKNNSALKKEIEQLYKRSCVIECKVLKSTYTPDDIQEIFDDICRLYFFKKKYFNRQAFLIITGIKKQPSLQKDASIQENIKGDDGKNVISGGEDSLNDELIPRKALNNTNTKSKEQEEESGIYEWLSYEINKEIELSYKTDNNYKTFYKDYNKRDKRKNDKSKPLSAKDYKISFITIPRAINYPVQDNETSHGVGIWEIVLPKKEVLKRFREIKKLIITDRDNGIQQIEELVNQIGKQISEDILQLKKTQEEFKNDHSGFYNQLIEIVDNKEKEIKEGKLDKFFETNNI